jgi:cystathionine beta-lyase/cystathionine gamma-synthase
LPVHSIARKTVMHRDPSTLLLHAMPAPADGDPGGSTLTMATYLVSSGDAEDTDYLRVHHPNWHVVERALGELEHGEAVLFASGQAASHAILVDLTRTHRRIVVGDDGYYNTRALAHLVGATTGVDVRTVDMAAADAVEDAIAGGDAALWVETPTNPLLRVADLALLGDIAQRHAAPLIVDNTVATAVLQQPARFGAAATVCSLTKAAAGHSDVLLGAVVTSDGRRAARLRDWRTLTGGIPGPFEAWLTARSLTTLPLRLAAQSAAALRIAEHLVADDHVTAVHYPGLTPHRAVADRQMTGGYGPLLSFEVAGGAAAADAVVAAARLIRAATSFGGVVSSWERRARWPADTAPPGLIRLSVGLEAVDDLLADIDGALGAQL